MIALYVILAVVALTALLLAVIATRPSQFRVSRSIEVAAPPDAPFERVNKLREWAAWSPWEKMDPDMKRAFEGPEAGVGAIYRWDGDKNIGAGSMTIIDSRPGERIGIRLEFLRPFACVNDVEFTFKPRGDATVVTWSMVGKNNFMGKAMHLVMNMDKMCGDQFAKGLAALKSIAEAEAGSVPAGRAVEAASR